MSFQAEKQWLLPAVVVGVVLCVFFVGSRYNCPANAQGGLQTGMDGDVLVIPVQLERDSYGLAMVDTVGQTMWIYEINPNGPAHKRLRLLAARSWRYDRLLQQYNTAEPRPEQVKLLLEGLVQPPIEVDEEERMPSDTNTLKTTEPEEDGLSR